MKKVFLTIALFASIIWWFSYDPNSFLKIESQVKNVSEKVSDAVLTKFKGEVLYSTPLISGKEVNGYELTHDGVFSETNIARVDNSTLKNLGSNNYLDRIASIRLKDMFDKQYFEHISPQGVGASDVAKDVGYEYVTIGENIALGNFAGDGAIVEAWMNSPGHRANILSGKFNQLGIAVGKGMYKGRSVWIGVQIFGKPIAACPLIDEKLKNEITSYQNVLLLAREQADVLATNLKNDRPLSREERIAYNQKVDKYNDIANQINEISASLKITTDDYNNQVRAFNLCVKN